MEPWDILEKIDLLVKIRLHVISNCSLLCTTVLFES